MFCPNCGAGEQSADAYCKRCGQWLPDLKSATRFGRRRPHTPEQKMRVVLVFNALNAALALFSAVALFTLLGRHDLSWQVPLAADFCLIICVQQLISFILNLQLRGRFMHRREEPAAAARQTLDGAAAHALGAADAGPFAEVRSVTEHTTELLGEPARRGERGERG